MNKDTERFLDVEDVRKHSVHNALIVYFINIINPDALGVDLCLKHNLH